jgi:hypothetical protein
MNMDPLWTFYARAGYVFSVLTWLLVGSVAALWWVPSYFGEVKPIPWRYGASCLLMLWVLVFNHWPRVGTRRFFRESRFLKLKVKLLVIVSCLFAMGFTIAA